MWCGVITVEESRGFYGFNSFNNSGELSDDEFDVGASSYTINTLSVQGDTGAEDYGDLTFDLAESPDAAGQAALGGLTLHLDNDEFSLSDSRPGPPGFYFWVAVPGLVQGGLHRRAAAGDRGCVIGRGLRRETGDLTPAQGGCRLT